MEEFEYQGYWWLPDRPEEKVPGTLTFDPHEGPKLNLLGSLKGGLEDLNKILEPELVLGLSSKGKPVTLWKCAETSSKMSFPGFATSIISADVVFVGHHFEREEEVGFQRLSVDYLFLDEWADTPGFVLKVPDDHTLHPMIIEHKRPEPVEAAVGEAQISLRFRQSLKTSNPLVKWATLTQTAYVTVEYPQRKHMDELARVVHHLRNFLTLGIGKPIRPLAIRGRVGQDEGPSAEVYYRTVGMTEVAGKVFPPQMLFTFHNLPGGFERSLDNWMRNADDLEPVYQLYFGTVYNPRAYLQQQFLSLMQALEAYHRRVIRTTEVPEEEHERRIEEIIASVPDERKGWLQRRLSYSNELYLSDKIRGIFRRYPESVEVIVSKKKKGRADFIDNVVVTRNYLTHYNKKLEDRAARDVRDLYQVTRTLRSLLEVCLMGGIGFEDGQIRPRWSGSSRGYRWLTFRGSRLVSS